ncbi:helix-turn-helix transcriptional regulator [Antarcticibacterium flavum]|uniref:Helix-turn-helix transcriptional regulator n=1 Tax=Antarcticibacterium flavum TaxID=2058175 RepID=A0A5B7X4E5_9FLAO|nr:MULTISPECIES: helix-turn-helix transcriptional regulator [Antarcticibacterium]MCM4158562.1 AraC family transcriptional regulator [Antarcticibacterium sp. W02-3]QCY70306.1 helix-turn-helix transcriptional regulator [Antarcticibacterium flavum]
MEGLFKFETVSEYNALNNHETLHPLVNIIDFSKANPRSWGGAKTIKINYGLYCIFLKEVKCGDLKYGRNYYDYQEGTLVFVSPGQVMEIENSGEMYQPIGHALVFHPDLISGTSLARSIQEYGFFSYKMSEALHLSEKERQLVLDCFSKIKYELQQGVDKHSKKLITSNIELFLNYCDRFYDRQFITRDNANRGILEKFEELLNGYFRSEMPQLSGLPSVAYFADELHLSPNYFGDLIKKETGKSAQEYIQNKIIEVSKNRMFNLEKSVNEIAYELGFKYPQHFTRLFKQRVGLTPKEFRNMN